MKNQPLKTSLYAGLIGVIICSLCLVGCGDSGDTGSTGDGTDPLTYSVPDTYTFGDTVSYGGQTARQVLIWAISDYISGLGDAIDSATFAPTAEGDVVETLDFYYRFDSDAYGEEAHGLTLDLPVTETSWTAISAGKNLADKFAGNDSATDHKTWSTEFAGWSDPAIAAHGGAIDSPEGLLTALFETLEAAAIDRANGTFQVGPAGDELPVYVTDSGLDLQQLIQKFLLVALTFSQGTDDYLDDDVADKGLQQTNVVAEGETVSDLAHGWDEAFGYFGAARDYSAYTDDEIAGKGGRDGWSSGYHDTDGNGEISLLSEMNFAASVNAAKRDRGASVDAPTDFTGEVFDAFLAGRALIHAVEGELSADQLAELEGHRDIIVAGWEAAIAATVVHYINEVLVDMDAFGTDEYSFTGHGKHFSELKGFALGFQFNPRSPLSDEDFVTLHTLIGDAPVLATADEADITEYRGDLLEARTLLMTAHGFDDENAGDDAGLGGW